MLLIVGGRLGASPRRGCRPPRRGGARRRSEQEGGDERAFCCSPVVDNYRAPLEKLKPIPAVPEGGVLPFAPAGLTLGITGPQGILVGGSSVGLRLTNAARRRRRRAQLGRARAADPLLRRRHPGRAGRAQTDRPQAAAGGQAPRPHLPAHRGAGDLLARNHDPEPPRPAARPLRRVPARRQPHGQRRDQIGRLRQRRPRRLPRKLLRKPRQRHGHPDRHQPRTLRRHDLAPGRSSARSTHRPRPRSSAASAPAKPNGSPP